MAHSKGVDESERRPHGFDDERTPLLSSTGDVAVGAGAHTGTAPDTIAGPVEITNRVHSSDGTPDDDKDDKPLPMRQMLFICYARIVEPIAFFGIFPFVNQMIQRNGSLPEAEVGFYSGLIESLFSLTQMVVMIFWGRLSDQFGRRPVLIASMAGVTVMTASFGFARTIWQMILLRCVGGVFSGSVVTLRVMTTEHSTPATQARAFSLFNVANNMGIFIGPLIGGSLADPATQYGGVFKKVRFFVDFPYALPTLVTGFIGLTATIVAVVFIEETLSTKKTRDQESGSRKQTGESLSIWKLLKQPGVPLVLFLYTHVLLMAYAYTAVIPVFWFTSVGAGGYGFSPYQISVFIALAGVAQALWTLFVFPPLHKRRGTGWIFRFCSLAYLFFYGLNPLLNLLLRHSEAHHVKWEVTLFWIAATFLIVTGSSVSLAFTAIQLALNDICPSPAVLGALNGLAMAIAAGTRSFVPALATTVFAVGIKKQILWGYLIWAVFFGLIVIYILLAFNLPTKAEGVVKKDVDRPEQDQEETGC